MFDEDTFVDEVNIIIIFYWMWRRIAYSTRSIWCREIFADRNSYGHGAKLLPTLRNKDAFHFRNFTRMTNNQFELLLYLVGDRLRKQSTNMRQPISPADRLALTLRFLATGTSYAELSYGFRIGKSTISNIVKSTCKIIIDVLKPMYLEMPTTVSEWQDIATEFEYKWNFPHCVGAIDGKHIRIQAPPGSGSKFLNYKNFHSIVLMAACDAFYCFTFIQVGNYGRISDGGVFRNTYLGQQLNTHPEFLPPPSMLPASSKVAPFAFVADEAFPLKPNLLRPFPGRYLCTEKRIFNYRLSRARRCIENAFGIMASRWRVLHTTIALSVDNTSLVTLACCCLHNFLMKTERSYARRRYCPVNFADNERENGLINEGFWRNDDELLSVQRQNGTTRAPRVAIDSRETFKDYFVNEGSVPWQNRLS